MSGEIGIGTVNADIEAGFDKIWDNLEFGAMGTLRLGYDRWALTTDIIYSAWPPLALHGLRDRERRRSVQV